MAGPARSESASCRGRGTHESARHGEIPACSSQGACANLRRLPVPECAVEDVPQVRSTVVGAHQAVDSAAAATPFRDRDGTREPEVYRLVLGTDGEGPRSCHGVFQSDARPFGAHSGPVAMTHNPSASIGSPEKTGVLDAGEGSSGQSAARSGLCLAVVLEFRSLGREMAFYRRSFALRAD